MAPTAKDLFCGAGGSTIGLKAAGFDVKLAANHWRLAVDTHSTNFPETEHDLADISQVDPRRYPATDVLWASPECTWHSQARGVSKKLMQDKAIAEGLPVEAAERSRATMWDVCRFAEAMILRGQPYKVILVENVADAVQWGPEGNGALFQGWLNIMAGLGYDHELVFLNSAFAGGGRYEGILPAPQSRDRLYIAFWLRSLGVKPDLTVTPLAPCASCETNVFAVQTFKRKDYQVRVNRYRAQYTYNCPTCKTKVEPYVRGAWEAVDWSLRGERIGDRSDPLADGTMKRIQAGLDKYADTPGLVVPVERNGKYWHTKVARPFDELLPTQTARATMGVAFTPFIASIRGGGSKTKCDAVTEPMATVSAGGNHHMLVMPGGFVMRNNNSSNPSATGAEMCTPFWEPIRALTTKGHQSVVISPHLVVPYNRTGVPRPADQPMHTVTTVDNGGLVSVQTDIMDCEFRMLQPHEQGLGMAFPADYVVLGNKRERTRQYGNAVTPPASELLATAVINMLAQVGLADAA